MESTARGFLVALCALCMMAAACSGRARYSDVAALMEQPSQNEPFNQSLVMMAAQADDGDYRIGAQDLLEVTLFDIEDHDGAPRVVATRVSNSGYVALPNIGMVHAEGLTTLEFEEQLKEKFKRYIHDPQLSVFIREYHGYEVSVVGYVEHPGVFQLQGRKTLVEALALAGGLNDDAGRSVRLMRSTDEGVMTDLIDLEKLAENGDPALNPALLPGDVINVPRAGVFYVEGMVNKPGAYPLVQDTTVSQALATAGGPDVKTARAGGTTLYRKLDSGDRVAIDVDLSGISAGKSEDFLVREDDLIVVPVSGPKFLLDSMIGLVRVGLNYR
jgi:polysaccharide export outer membrane protein